MSYYTHISARNIHYTQVKEEIQPVPQSPFFDMTMDEENMEGGERFLPANDSQSSKTSTLFDDSESESETKDSEVKAGTNVINRILSMEEITNTNSEAEDDPVSQCTQQRIKESNSSANTNNSFRAALGHSTNNTVDQLPSWAPFSINQNKGWDLTPKASVCKQISNQGRQYSCFSLNNLPHKDSDKQGDPDKGIPTSSLRCNSKPRPMRLDPDTQEVMEINEFDSDSDSSDVELVDDIQETAVDNETVDMDLKNKAMPSGHSPTRPPLPLAKKPNMKMDLVTEDDCNRHLSLNGLRRLYFIKKIQMINQRTDCFKVLEEKLRWELTVLQQQTLFNDPGTMVTSSSKVPSRSCLRKTSSLRTYSSDSVSKEVEEEPSYNISNSVPEKDNIKRTKGTKSNGSCVDSENSINLEAYRQNNNTKEKQKHETSGKKANASEKGDDKEQEVDQRANEDEESDLPRKMRSGQRSSCHKFRGRKRKLNTDNSEGNQQTLFNDPGTMVTSSSKVPSRSCLRKTSSLRTYSSDSVSKEVEEEPSYNISNSVPEKDNIKRTKGTKSNGSCVDSENSINLEAYRQNNNTKEKQKHETSGKKANASEKGDDKEQEVDQRANEY